VLSSLPTKTEMPPRLGRAVSAVEFLVGAFIVIGHNVLRVIPNEVPILVVLGLVSIRVRNGGWSALGFKRPSSWRLIIVVAVAAAALRIILSDFVIELASRFWPPPAAPAGAEAIAGNLKAVLWWLLVVWTFAAFGEEIAYRGYLLNRAAEVGKGTTDAFWGGMVLTSVLFGLGHYYKGPSGIIDSGMAGLILGTAYLLTGRNLWTSILAHGLIDTVGIFVAYFGLES
jgi:membrane protease YdiL (CAAX protease family)